MNDMLWELKIDKALDAIKENKRLDERKLDEYRPITVTKEVIQSAEGSAKVKIGKTEVIAGVKLVLGEPYPDTPNEGGLAVGVERLPLASPDFQAGFPGAESMELARVVDRGIRESKALDFKKLCVTKGEKVWITFLDVYALDYDGNLFDASALAGIVSLNNAKIPKLEDNKIVKGEYSGKISLNMKPVLSTFAKLGETIILDPSLVEEKAMSARISMSTTEKNNVCAFQKGGSGSFTVQEIDQAIDIALQKSKELRKFI